MSWARSCQSLSLVVLIFKPRQGRWLRLQIAHETAVQDVHVRLNRLGRRARGVGVLGGRGKIKFQVAHFSPHSLNMATIHVPTKTAHTRNDVLRPLL